MVKVVGMNADLAHAVRQITDEAVARRVAEYKARRERIAVERAARKARRDAGLKARHATKLARQRGIAA